MVSQIRGYASLVGIEYKSLNCWELVEEFYSRVFDIELKHFFDEVPDSKEEIQNLIYTNKGDFEKVETPEFGDIMTIKVFGLESHIGVFLGEGKMLHTLEKTGSIVDSISKWEKVITGYYRVKINK